MLGNKKAMTEEKQVLQERCNDRATALHNHCRERLIIPDDAMLYCELALCANKIILSRKILVSLQKNKSNGLQ